MKTQTSIDALEVAKFSQHAAHWWDIEGPLKTLHDINPARLEFVRKFIPIAGCRLLDVGCGGGIFSEALALAGAVVTGLDVEPEAIGAATAHALNRELSLTYVCQSIETYEATAFDAVLCMEMLEHVPEPLFVIEQAARFVKPGGYLFLSTINRTLKAYASVVLAAEYLLRLLPRQTHDFSKFIKPSELAFMVRKVGLDVVGMAGLAYQPITRVASLETSVDVNYLMACRKG